MRFIVGVTLHKHLNKVLYSTSVDERAIRLYNLLYQVTGIP